jgi:hypothetical protein
MAVDGANFATQTMFAELTQRTLDAEFDALYDERGSFSRKRIGTKEYWYYKRSKDGKKRFTYVGPIGDKAINERVKRFEDIKSDFRQRRVMVRALVAAGMPSPDPMAGEVIEALWKGGFFRLRGVLIGTLAFQCYGGILGIRLSGVSLKTGDADLAQFYDVTHMVGDTMPPILDVLRHADPTFGPVPNINHPHRVTRFRTAKKYLVEFLTPNRGSAENQSEPAEMPALGGASALPLRYLDYLIHEPIWSVVLHKGGVPVRVPSPERFAVHKIMLAVLRRVDPAKSSKDINQAEQLIEACMPQRSYALYEAWLEACERDPVWRENLMRGREMLSSQLKDRFIVSLQIHGWSEKQLAKKQPKIVKPPPVSTKKRPKLLGKLTRKRANPS